MGSRVPAHAGAGTGLHLVLVGPGVGAQTDPPGARSREWFSATATGACSERFGGYVPQLSSYLSLLVAPASLQEEKFPCWRDAVSSTYEVNCLL